MRWVLCFKRLDFATENALFWGFLGVLLQDFTKMQNLISLNISVLQLKLCIFVFLQICICETASVRQLKQSFIALTYSQLYKCEPAYFAPLSTKNHGFSKSSLLYLSGQPVSAFITEQPAARAMASPAAVSHSIVGA